MTALSACGPGSGVQGLSDDHIGALSLIVKGEHHREDGSPLREAWVLAATVETAYPGSVEPLVEGGWVERWDCCPFGPALAITPLAAFRLGVTTHERWELGSKTIEKFEGPGVEPKRVLVKTATEVCYEDRADIGDPLWCVRPGLDRLPPHALHVPLTYPELLVDSRPGPEAEFLNDPETDEPLELFSAAPKGWRIDVAGVKIRIDKRLGKKRKAKPKKLKRG